MKKYLLSRLLEPSTWIGLALILGAFIAPRWFILLVGAALIFSGDSWLKGWVSRNAPGIASAIDEWTKDA